MCRPCVVRVSSVANAEYSLFYRALLQKRPMILIIGVSSVANESESIIMQTSLKHSLTPGYGATTISRLLRIIGLFCKRAL